MAKKKMIAMILAGGQGSRLKTMTKNMAKPAVPFGAKYRIIDFVLSNCSNSGIDTVGVLTQYKPQMLNAHVGIGAPWDLDRIHGGAELLAPYFTEQGGDWYKGTANAVYQNMGFMDHYDPKYVVILSGDHIYKMDYRKMLDEHRKKKADATIAVIDVSLEEASRFGIMNTNEDGQIIEFEEKPEHPKSTLASMGIYIFNYQTLRKYLIEDANDPNSDYDFGKNIIPKMIADNNKLIAYKFEGYWKDVGTVESYWEANMDLLSEHNAVKLFDNSWKLYTETGIWPAQHIGREAIIKNCLISEGCEINGIVENSIIFPGVFIEPGAHISDSIIMESCTVRENAVINKAIIMKRTEVCKGVKIGDGSEIKLLDQDLKIEEDVK